MTLSIATWSRRSLAGIALSMVCASGCSAVYPEIKTPLRQPIDKAVLKPPPPEDVFWVHIKEGRAPEKTRDGRPWHELGSGKPNPYAILFVNGKELIRTTAHSHTLNPKWPKSPKGNFIIGESDQIRIEMWESALVTRPICVKQPYGSPSDWADQGEVEVVCDETGSSVKVSFERAHGLMGYGFAYEFRAQDAWVTRVYKNSPAAAAGLLPGDHIHRIGPTPIRSVDEIQVRSYLNADRAEGIALLVEHPGKKMADIRMKPGAVYPLFSEFGPLPLAMR